MYTYVVHVYSTLFTWIPLLDHGKWYSVGNRYIGQINEAFKIHSPAAWYNTLHNSYSITSAKLKCIYCSTKRNNFTIYFSLYMYRCNAHTYTSIVSTNGYGTNFRISIQIFVHVEFLVYFVCKNLYYSDKIRCTVH